jgi:hypothetical protein
LCTTIVLAMLIARRDFLAASTLTGLLDPILRRAAVVRAADPVVDPRDFGARFDGRSDDTSAWQAAIDHAAAKGLIVAPRQPGTSVLVCNPIPRGTYGNNPNVDVYQAIDINRSGLTIDFRGTRLRLHGYGQRNAVNYAFGTAKNLAPGAITRLRITNGVIDFDPTGDHSINKRSFYFVGVDDLEMGNLLLTSSGARAGATITLQNCRRVRISNLRGINITQGMNLSYVEEVALDTLMFDNFSEAVDCDRRVRRLVARNLTFLNGGPNNQCLDLNSVEDVLVSGITARDVGNIALVNYKVTTPRTYREYVANAAVTRYSPSRNVTIERVQAERICHPKSNTIPFKLGNDQRHRNESQFPLENITLRHVVLMDCPSFIPVELVKNALLENILFIGALNPNSNMGCIDIRGDLFGTGATLQNVRVLMEAGATCGIRSNGPAFLKLRNVYVAGASVSGATFFELTSLDQHHADVQFSDVTALATSGSEAVAFDFGDGRTGSNYSIELASNIRTRGKFAKRLVFKGDAARHLKGSRKLAEA